MSISSPPCFVAEEYCATWMHPLCLPIHRRLPGWGYPGEGMTIPAPALPHQLGVAGHSSFGPSSQVCASVTWWFLISLLMSDVRHLFTCLHAAWCPTGCTVFEILQVSDFFLVSLESSWRILDASPLSDICLANTFSHSAACLFFFLTVCFKKQKF